MNALEIIGKLYTLLSECNSRELGEAASIAGDSDLGFALAELAKAKQAIESKQHGKHNRRVPTNSQPSVVPSHDQSTKRIPPRNGIESRLERIVLDPRVISSNSELAIFLTSLGLDATFRKKDGRQIMLRKLLDAIYSLDADSKKRVLSTLFSVLPKTETSGWFDAIRGEAE